MQTHPVYDLYQADSGGNIQHLVLKKKYAGAFNKNGDLIIRVRPKDTRDYTCIQVHRFVWECFHGLVPEGKKVVHSDGNKTNNRLDNLKLTEKTREYSFVKNNHYKLINYLATNIQTRETTVFPSLYQLQKKLGISPKTVQSYFIDKRPRRGYTFAKIL